MVEVYREYAPRLLLTPGGEYFLSFLRATLLHDYYLLGEKLTFLYHIEHLVRRATDILWQDALGPSWQKRIMEEGTAIEMLRPKQPVDRLTLKGRVRIMAKLVASGDVPEASVENALGKKWQDNLLDEFVFNLRNDLAHGHVYDDAFVAKFEADWERYAHAVSYLCELYNRLTGGANAAPARKSG